MSSPFEISYNETQVPMDGLSCDEVQELVDELSCDETQEPACSDEFDNGESSSVEDKCT
ncbi:18187_t:CDS:1, partial [Racocetra fulgida]